MEKSQYSKVGSAHQEQWSEPTFHAPSPHFDRHILGDGLEKRQEIELLRVLSAFGIVWFHIAPMGNDIGYSGLIVFIILSLYLSANSHTAVKPVSNRFKRLIIPWLFWYVFYAVLNILLKRPVINTDKGLIPGILAGPSIHLWYMPYMFVMLIFFDRIKHRVNVRVVSLICILTTLPIFALSILWRPASFEFAEPWTQYLHAANGVLLGFFFANFDEIPSLFSSAILFLAAAMSISVLFVSGIGIPYSLGIMASSLVILPRWNLSSMSWVNHLSDCTLGIYLSHPFWNFVVTTQTHVNVDNLTLPIVVFFLSVTSVWIVKRVMPEFARFAM